MPELPEVETVGRQLQEKITGRTIESVEVFHDKTVGHDTTIEDRLHGKTVADIERIGKLMIISFAETPDLFLLAHLKMTGQFFFVDTAGSVIGGGHSMTESEGVEFPHKHTRITFHFTDRSALHFNDMRLFGYTKLADADATELARAMFGPEPIADDFD